MEDRDIEHRLTEVEARSKSNTLRLDDMEKRQDNLDDLVGTVKILALREENVEADVKEIKQDVKALTSKPAEHWNDMIKTILGVIAAAIAGFILAKLGLG